MAENQRQGENLPGQGGQQGTGQNDDVFKNDRDANRQGEMTRNREDEKRGQSDQQRGQSSRGSTGRNE